MEVAEVHQGMSHGSEISFGSLDLEYFPITLFCAGKLIHQRAGIAKVSERSRECLWIGGSSIISDGRFPCRTSLEQITAMEKDPGAMFMILSHEIMKCYLVKCETQERTMSDARWERRFTRYVYC